MTIEARLKKTIRTIPNYPKAGILFRDITPVLQQADLLSLTVDALVAQCKNLSIDYVAAIEARGFIFGGAVAQGLGAGFIPIRKKGKLPAETVSMDYMLEYGSEAIEIHKDAVPVGAKILLLDDLIATGGTALAAVDLLRQQGAEIVGASFMIDLVDLGGAQQLRERNIFVQQLVCYHETEF